jgi:hypothetical protein
VLFEFRCRARRAALRKISRRFHQRAVSGASLARIAGPRCTAAHMSPLNPSGIRHIRMLSHIADLGLCEQGGRLLSGCFFQSCAPYAKASRLLALVARDVPNLVRDALAPTSFVLRLKYVAGVHNQRSSRFQYFSEAAGQHRRCIELSEMTALMTCLEARLVHEIAQQLVERLHADPQHLGELHPLLVGKVGPIQ